jgi:aryl-alcohol dehydrogenase-like predicted oxidoreductase
MLVIPGTSKVSHLEDNVAAAGLTLSREEFGYTREEIDG